MRHTKQINIFFLLSMHCLYILIIKQPYLLNFLILWLNSQTHNCVNKLDFIHFVTMQLEFTHTHSPYVRCVQRCPYLTSFYLLHYCFHISSHSFYPRFYLQFYFLLSEDVLITMLSSVNELWKSLFWSCGLWRQE